MKQLAIFLENQPGALASVTEILTASGIDIKAMSLADTTDFGILRLIVNDSRKGADVLKDNGIIASVTDVTVITMKHEVGSLSSVLKFFDAADVNIEYMYAFTASSGKEAYAVFRFADSDRKKGVETLLKNGIKLYTEEDFQ